MSFLKVVNLINNNNGIHIRIRSLASFRIRPFFRVWLIWLFVQMKSRLYTARKRLDRTDETAPANHGNHANNLICNEIMKDIFVWVASCRQHEACSVQKRRMSPSSYVRLKQNHYIMVSPRQFFLKNIHVHANTVEINKPQYYEYV